MPRSELGSSYPGYRALMLALFGRSGRPPAWRARAACRDEDPAVFDDPDRTDDALAVCAGCPVVEECRTDQLAWERQSGVRRFHPSGVVGGLTGTERHRIHYPPKKKEVA
ncbi:WhiB family transcriptional regulator [Gandjariella thermophila]|uniref:4Fe-4S Wbl-type domain-containing protein n=1 Tax=Gandjariella thermophila TaxID=1931992 RepID=A0A4D4IX47_9PSEU|nr:WhiB family transcriptional regulator [Gandjariella thermophila]GDY28771.1 hypothetical protein GTS_04040 [Gandjariella thermophila]